MVSLPTLLGADTPVIDVVDVGALWLGQDTEVYAPLLKLDLARVVGFEPVPEELAKLQTLYGAKHTFMPYCLGDGSRGLFRVGAAPMTSSLFEPNLALAEQFQNLAEMMATTARMGIQTRRLDDIAEVSRIDYLKLDVQGAELDVLKGAVRRLRDVLVVHTEVCFVPLYEGIPLFGDIDVYLRHHGFLLHNLRTSSRCFKPIVRGNDLNAPGSQVLWGDAVYVRDFMALEQLKPEQMLKLALILHEIYQALDLVHFVLMAYDRRTGNQLAPAYLERLTTQP